MKSNHKSPIWPYLAVLACLFAVCVLAPRGWQQLARTESIDAHLDAHAPHISDRTRRWQTPPRQMLAASEAVAQPAAEPALASEPIRGAAASNEPAWIDARGGNTFSATTARADTAAQPVAQANGPARQPGPEPGGDRSGKNPWSLFRTAATRTAGSPTRTVSQVTPPVAVADELPAASPPPAETRTAVEHSPAQTLRDKISQHGYEAIRFPLPEALLAELQALAGVPSTSDWALATQRLLHELCDAQGGGRAAPEVLGELRRQSQQGEQLAASIADPRVSSQMLRAQYSLARRVEVWDRVVGLSVRTPVDADALVAQRMPVALDAVESLTRAQQGGTAWRDYLLLPRLRRLVGRDNGTSPDDRRKIARHVLTRLSNVRLSAEQRRFIDEKAMADFRSELQHWAAEPVDHQELLIDLERYERTGTALDAHRLAANCRWLCWSPDADSQQLGTRLEEHYRNANIRLAVSQSFLNRFLPQPGATVAPVRDTIAGAEVEGQSTTYTRLALLLIPDRNRLRMGIEAHGTVQSNTAATSGPATFHSTGESQFVARKLLLLGPQGMTVFPAMSEAESKRQQLVSVETNFDRVPLLNSVVRNIARSEHDASQGAAVSEVEQKIAARARVQFDSEFDPKLHKSLERFNERVRAPLDRLGLEPQTLAASSSDDRAVLRLRLAGQDQLAAYTPRPRAPSDSLVSLQVHQSALNNALEKLDLDGRTFTLDELFAHLGPKLGRPQADLPDDLPKNVSVTFAQHDAVRLNCDDGQIEVRISLADLTERHRHWKNFVVRTYYRPDNSSLETRFVRTGGIFLEGESLKGKTQFALRSVFSKILSPNRNWGLIDPKFAADPRAADLEITQFEVDKGWIGIAYAARRAPLPVANRTK